ncbi:MAG TPA: nucleotidyltransferase domain-containing protein [Chitinophagaceae bacterium]|jgi:Predicted nucleotidyltransferases
MMFGLKPSHINAINNCFEKCNSIERVIVYGSRAKGNYKPGSDIDLTIVDKEMSYGELLKLENQLDDLLLPYKIDLSLKRQISNPELLAHIERVGKTFYDKVSQNILNETPSEYKPQAAKKKKDK